jgi:lysozyme family protein
VDLGAKSKNMAEFKTAFQKTLNHEGAYVNDTDDLGKETYKGISRSSHNKWLGWAIIEKYKSKSDFPSMLDKDIELQKQVELFYLYEFWLPLKADQIQNQTSADSIFDFAVNSGIKTTVLIVQSVVGTKTDGIIGEQTLKKLNSLDFGYFQPAFTVAKITRYISIIQKRPTNKKHLYGWIIRALSFHAE